MKHIATKLHAMLELSPLDPVLREATTLPHYVVDSAVVEKMGMDAIASTLTALVNAGIRNLPYKNMAVEYETSQGLRVVAVLHEADAEPVYRARCTIFGHTTENDGSKLGRVGTMDDWMDVTLTRFNPEEHAAEVEETDRLLAACGVSFEGARVDGPVVRTRTATKRDEMFSPLIGVALGLALLVLSVRGIEKQVVSARDVAKVNKQRAARGKPAVPEYTLLRIGTVYDSKGNGISAGEAKRRRMPVHLRAGHTRMQPHGPNRSERKLVFIPPVLVNYVGNEDVTPRQTKRIVTL